MKKCTLLLILFFPLFLRAQECLHTGISHSFDLHTRIVKMAASGSMENDSFVVTVEIRQKKTGRVRQRITYGSGWFLDSEFAVCTNIRSYSTGLNDTAGVTDNDYGDVIVTDLNFDGREDLALIRNSGGNGGAVYHFYIQNAKGYFERSDLLSDYMAFFPAEIDPLNKMFTTRVRANISEVTETVFMWQENGRTWVVVKKQVVPVE
ncbi:MAG: XAC2610-related protein [Flavobacteriales bacterium]